MAWGLASVPPSSMLVVSRQPQHMPLQNLHQVRVLNAILSTLLCQHAHPSPCFVGCTLPSHKLLFDTPNGIVVSPAFCVVYYDQHVSSTPTHKRWQGKASIQVCRVTYTLQQCLLVDTDVLIVCAERDSGPSAGPTMSLCNWLPPHSAATHTQSGAEGSSACNAATPHPFGHTHSMQSRQQFRPVPPQHRVPQQQQHYSFVSNQLCGNIKQQGQESRQQPAFAYRAAERKRRQCLLEIERELLRHSSSDDEAPPDDLQLPNHSAGKRRKTACTGEDIWLAVTSLLAFNKKLYANATNVSLSQRCKSNCIVKFDSFMVVVYRIC